VKLIGENSSEQQNYRNNVRLNRMNIGHVILDDYVCFCNEIVLDSVKNELLMNISDSESLKISLKN